MYEYLIPVIFAVLFVSAYIILVPHLDKYTLVSSPETREPEEPSESCEDCAKIYIPSKYGRWALRNKIHRRLDTVFIDPEIKDELIHRLSDFKQTKEWHEKMQFPYRIGILLHGSIGSGKTSLISAVANEYDWDIYNLSITDCLAKKINIQSRISAIPKDRISMIVIEDLDFELNQLGDKYASVVPKLLSIMDGLLSNTNHVLFVTATSLDAIPDEFKREGRFDFVYNITAPSRELIIEYFKWFYETDYDTDNVEDELSTVNQNAIDFADMVPDGIRMCVIQNHLRKYRLDPIAALEHKL